MSCSSCQNYEPDKIREVFDFMRELAISQTDTTIELKRKIGDLESEITKLRSEVSAMKGRC